MSVSIPRGIFSWLALVIPLAICASCAEPTFAERWYATELQPIECHVRFVDQDGQSVAKVQIAAAIYTATPGGLREESRVLRGGVTDDAGEFHLAEERGGKLWLKVSDPRYLHGSELPGMVGGTFLFYTRITSEGNRNYGTVAKPAVIPVWKKEGPQPLIALNGQIAVPFTGVPLRVDLVRGCLVDEGGDLIVELQMPATDAERKAQANHLGRFPFTCSVKCVDGGLRPQSTNEYDATHGIHGEDFGPIAPGKHIQFRGLVRTRNGKVQGKMNLFIGVEDVKRGSGRVVIRVEDALINATASRSLEVDPARLVKLKLADGPTK